MELNEDIQLGYKVRDRISGFEGIVTDIALHISGCTRFGVYPIDNSDRGSQEWFYGTQLKVQNANTDLTPDAADSITESQFTVGEKVRDEITKIEGYVTTITFDIYNCPQIGIKPTSSDRKESADKVWADEPHVESIDDGMIEKFEPLTEETEEAATGSVGSNKPVEYNKP